MQLNILLQTIHRSADDLVLLDPYGAGLAIISVSIVFAVLVSLYIIFRSIGKVFQSDFKFRKQKNKTDNLTNPIESNEEPSGEVCAAIAMALYYYNSQNHDYENTIITIKKRTNDYSPWSSKIHGLRKTLNK